MSKFKKKNYEQE